MRIYHAGQDRGQRGREQALAAAGVDVTLVVPSAWHGQPQVRGYGDSSCEPFRIVQAGVMRSGDVNRHAYTSSGGIRRILHDVRPDVLDLHEEPFSVATRQWLRAAQVDLPIVMYTAQNVDKRYPPPFAQYERAAYRRAAALYPCSRQAAAVARGKGFAGAIVVLPLGYDDRLFFPGDQSLDDDELVLVFVGRFVREKGIDDAVRVLAHVNAQRPARLVAAGAGPEEGRVRELAERLSVSDRVELVGWCPAEQLAALYRAAHVVLVPSTPTHTWVEQFGRVIVEGQASGAVVAAYSSGAIAEVAGAAGILAPAGDVAGLGSRVAALVLDSAAFRRRRRYGFRLSRTRTWHQVAARQVTLYRTVVTGEAPRSQLPRSPRRRRARARAEFGPTAATTAGKRPFALPFLRQSGPPAQAFAFVLDLAGELRAHVSETADRRSRD